MQKLKLLFLLCLPLLSVSCATIKPIDTASLKPEEGIIFGSIKVLDDQNEAFNQDCSVRYGERNFLYQKVARIQKNGIFVITAPETNIPQRIALSCPGLIDIELTSNYAYKIKAGEVAYAGALEFKMDIRNNNPITKFLLVFTFGQLLNINNKFSVATKMTDNFKQDLELLKENRTVLTKSPVVKKLYFVDSDQNITRNF